ncbi:unnamed protein product [Meloidogyne enterolobii]|uniref:Uncharacterized protein n=1 Tax=Meloidogyne enterolobii TaxID=390850 RepID=A0ACB0ZVQ4_MELEN
MRLYRKVLIFIRFPSFNIIVMNILQIFACSLILTMLDEPANAGCFSFISPKCYCGEYKRKDFTIKKQIVSQNQEEIELNINMKHEIGRGGFSRVCLEPCHFRVLNLQ